MARDSGLLPGRKVRCADSRRGPRIGCDAACLGSKMGRVWIQAGAGTLDRGPDRPHYERQGGSKRGGYGKGLEAAGVGGRARALGGVGCAFCVARVVRPGVGVFLDRSFRYRGGPDAARHRAVRLMVAMWYRRGRSGIFSYSCHVNHKEGLNGSL